MPNWLECQCVSCHRTITFTPEQTNTWINCPFCKHSVFLCLPKGQETRWSGIRPKNVPAWVFVTLSLVSIVALLSFGFVKWVESLVGLEFTPRLFWSYYAGWFVLILNSILWISFLVYVVISLRGMRIVLKQIELNTRIRTLEESRAGTSAPNPIAPQPSEEQKYMPKG